MTKSTPTLGNQTTRTAVSHISNVKSSLENLVFLTQKTSRKTIQQKKLFILISGCSFLFILGIFFSTKGSAEGVAFHPNTCLGGWVNPHNAEQVTQTSSNHETSEFTKENSAVLSENTHGEIYCGSFSTEIKPTGTPKKMILSIAWATGPELILKEVITGESFASSTQDILDAGTSDVSFSSASSTEYEVEPVIAPEEPEDDSQTPLGEPISMILYKKLSTKLLGALFPTVFAQETSETPIETPSEEQHIAEDVPQAETQPTDLPEVLENETDQTQKEIDVVTSGDEATASTTSEEPLLEEATTSEIITHSNIEDVSETNFLDVSYTFDGIAWESLGQVNESSLLYKTFEIPAAAIKNKNIAHLQVKITPLQRIDPSPAVYLDGMKLEVLYEETVSYEHPDFARDTILKDISDGGVRAVNIINSDTDVNEIWYTTLTDQGDFGIAPGTWVHIDLENENLPYTLVDVYGDHLFWFDEQQKMLWVRNLEKGTTDGIGLSPENTIEVPFIKENGEAWLFEYDDTTKLNSAKIVL